MKRMLETCLLVGLALSLSPLWADEICTDAISSGGQRQSNADFVLYDSVGGIGGTMASANEFVVNGFLQQVRAGCGVTVDLIPPIVITSIVEGGLPQRSMLRSLAFQFSEDVSASLEPGDLVLENLTTAATIDPGVMTLTYDSATNTATWTFNFPGPFFESLPDGNYCATLPAAAVEDPGGNNPNADSLLAFHRVFGDRDGDTDVDFLDSIRFRTCFFAPPNCDFRFDVDSDTDVDFLDLINFGSRFPSQLAPVSCP